MNEKAEALPASEFDPRATQPLHDSMFDLPIRTVGKLKDRIAGLLIDIEQLKAVDGITNALKAAKAYAIMVLNYVEEHEKGAAAMLEAEIERHI